MQPTVTEPKQLATNRVDELEKDDSSSEEDEIKQRLESFADFENESKHSSD